MFLYVILFFFFKQKTAYEMRISDWSSDVCSSDLVAVAESAKAAELRRLLRELRQHVEHNCDYVGERFAEEARKIHYGETDPRGIYGETSDAEAEADRKSVV